MMTTFRPLCTLAVSHAYYSAGCRDFDFIVPVDTAAVLANGKLLVKIREGVVHVLFEADRNGQPLWLLAGARLRFGMRLRNPQFATVTGPTVATPLYRNSAVADSLDPPVTVHLSSHLFSHDLVHAERPVIVSLRAPTGQEVVTETITAENDRAGVSFDLVGRHPGLYRLEELYPATPVITNYYIDSELQRSAVFGVVEVQIASSFYNVPPALTIAFAPREEVLKYYLVVNNYSAAECDSLMITDAGFAGDQRPQLLFDRIESQDFTGQDISPALLTASGGQVILFQSRGSVPRRERARKNIELRKNGDVLIKHLPQIGAADVSGKVVIHISKP